LGMGASLVRVGGPTSGTDTLGGIGAEVGTRVLWSKGWVGSWAIDMGGMLGTGGMLVGMLGMLVTVVTGTVVGCVGNIIGVSVGGPDMVIIWGPIGATTGAIEVCKRGGRGIPGMPGAPWGPGEFVGPVIDCILGIPWPFIWPGCGFGPGGLPGPMLAIPPRGDIFCFDFGLGWFGRLPLKPILGWDWELVLMRGAMALEMAVLPGGG
jgi:hypothetical protein